MKINEYWGMREGRYGGGYLVYSAEIYGEVKGVRLDIEMVDTISNIGTMASHSSCKYEGKVDGETVSEADARELFYKYREVAHPTRTKEAISSEFNNACKKLELLEVAEKAAYEKRKKEEDASRPARLAEELAEKERANKKRLEVLKGLLA